MNHHNQTRKRPKEINFIEFLVKMFIVFIIAVTLVASCIYLANVAVKHVDKMEQRKTSTAFHSDDYLLQ